MLDNQGGAPEDVELLLGREDATVADLLDALPDAGQARGIVLDGRFCHVDLALSEIGLYEGARIRPADGAPPAASDPHPALLELRVIAGFDAGRRVPLPPEGLVVGRDEECDVSLGDEGVSRRHLRVAPSPGGLRATVTDLGSVNGTWVEGRRIREPADVEPEAVFEAGDVALTIAPRRQALPVDPVRQAGVAGTIPFNRPPRSRPAVDERTLTAPDAPGEVSRPHFSVAAAVGPLVLGAVMVVALHSIIYALFMLLSPVLVIGSWLEQRRQASRSSRGGRREYEQKLAAFQADLARHQADALARRRDAYPDLAEVVRRATAPDPRLWERRPGDDDFLALSAGYGEVPFRPALTERHVTAPDAELLLAEHGWLQLAPVGVDLAGGGVVGIVGDREQGLSLARALVCQAAVLHGPADLTIALFTDPEGREDWDFAKWLPHARDAGGGAGRRLAVGAAAGAALVAELSERDADDPRQVLAVLDSPALIEGRGAAGRALLRSGQRVSGIVIARSSERLPAACTTVVELADEAGEARLLRPQIGERVDPLLVAGVSAPTARECALALARFDDADLQLAGGALPAHVGLLPLLGILEPSAEDLRARWAAAMTRTGLAATFALSEDGPLHVDLVADGPHGLVAGTTGAGKSELLRSLVASLAAEHPPTRVNFVLIDYKGGSAFGECAQLPHTVGLVTDLDEHLGERALRSLEAELRYRERVLREHRAADLIEYDRLAAAGRTEPLPRLLVVIDEFATLAAELPDFVPSLVGIAQRGRSLGVHLVLATQRPSGAVNENIRANTNLRICLRVQTPQDSADVIDSPAAARIPRSQPGRAQVRLGPSELIPVQTALVSGVTAGGRAAAVTIESFAAGADAAPADRGEDGAGSGSDLQQLAAAAEAACAGGPPLRRPWLPPLRGDIALEEVLAAGAARPLAGERGLVVPLALADDAEAQAQYPVGWNLNAGNLLLYGLGGSGTTTTLATLTLSLAQTADPDHVHIYVLDFGAGELGAVARLPHVGAVIGAAEHERQRRLLHRLRGELAVRRGLDAAARAAAPRIVLLLDGYGGFASEHSDLAGDALRDALARVWADGPELGVHVAISADRLGAVPTALASLAQQRLAFQLADVADYAQFGINRRAIPHFVPGRAVVGGSGQVIQVARARGPLPAAVERLAAAVQPGSGGPPPVGVLPETVGVGALLGAGRPGRGPGGDLFVPLGIGDETLEAAGFDLYEGDHAIIAGPARTGRSTALLVVAEVMARLHPEIPVFAIAPRRSPLRDAPGVARSVATAEEIAELVTELRSAERLQMLLVDDADVVDDPTRALSDLFAAPLPTLHAVVAGRTDALRSLGHWSVGVRRSRTGLLLQPDVTVDGPLLGVTLPRRPTPPVRPGCGYRVDPGGFELMQVALPEPHLSAAPTG
ncbi:MAG TPA: FtsK/SpoIIIE domain-containing protein [Solirubrobacteraceae bacterium]|nr:FtsK/SpoIIIE domain-containing protein [Solirubrobacteraceae bacterium]